MGWYDECFEINYAFQLDNSFFVFLPRKWCFVGDNGIIRLFVATILTLRRHMLLFFIRVTFLIRYESMRARLHTSVHEAHQMTEIEMNFEGGS